MTFGVVAEVEDIEPDVNAVASAADAVDATQVEAMTATDDETTFTGGAIGIAGMSTKPLVIGRTSTSVRR